MLTRVELYTPFLYPRPRWNIWYCPNFYCTRFQVDMCDTVKFLPILVSVETSGTSRIFVIHMSTLAPVVLWICFYFTRGHVDSCFTAQFFVAYPSILTRVVLYQCFAHMSILTRVEIYTFSVYTRASWYGSNCTNFRLHTSPRWQASHCTSSNWSLVLVDTCGTAQTFIVQVSTLRGVALYKTFLHVSCCEHFNVHMSTLTNVVLLKFYLDTSRLVAIHWFFVCTGARLFHYAIWSNVFCTCAWMQFTVCIV